MSEARLFVLQRDQDISGISGTGIVADGVQWPNGQVTLCWRGEHSSVAVWPCMSDAMWCHGHDGATKAVFDDGEIWV